MLDVSSFSTWIDIVNNTIYAENIMITTQTVIDNTNVFIGNYAFCITKDGLVLYLCNQAIRQSGLLI